MPRELRFVVSERVGPEGVLLALDAESVQRAVEEVSAARVDAVAVCLLFSFVDPAHERAIRDALRAALPAVHISLSSEVLPEFREYERFATTTADAYLGPGLAAYLRRLGERLATAGLPQPVVMQSSGGVTDLETAAALASSCVLSGPAGGVVAAAFVAERERVLRPPHLRHGRHEHRRLRRAPRRGADDDGLDRRGHPDQAPDGGRAHGERRRRVGGLDRQRRCAPRRPAIGGSRAGTGVLRQRRQRGHGHRRRPVSRLSPGRPDARRRGRPEPEPRRARRSAGSRPAWASTRSRPPPGWSSSPRPR